MSFEEFCQKVVNSGKIVEIGKFMTRGEGDPDIYYIDIMEPTDHDGDIFGGDSIESAMQNAADNYEVS